MTITLNGFPPEWDAFVQGIRARRKLPKFEKKWEDCAQEEPRLLSKSQELEYEEDQALAAHARKGKKRQSFKVGERRFPYKKRDMSQVRCFNSDKLGHFARDCT